jgi:acetoacetyl-CoA synthetase
MSAPNIPQIRLYQDWLRETRGLSFDSYDALWRWSTTDLERLLAKRVGLL